MPDWLQGTQGAVWIATLAMLVANGLLFCALLVQRTVAVRIEARRRERSSRLTPLVLEALAAPESIDGLLASLTRADLLPLRELLLRMALDVKGEELRTLGEIYDLSGLLDRDLAATTRGSSRRRASAVARLGLIHCGRSISAIAAAIDDAKTRVRLEAIRSAGKLGHEPLLLELVRLLEDDDPRVVRRASETIGRYGTVTATAVHELLESTDSTRAKRAAIELLGWLRHMPAAPLLALHAEDPDMEIRVRVAKAAPLVGDPALTDVLHVLLEDETWEVRCQAAKGLIQLGGPGSIARLAASLHDRHWWVRFYAAVALAELGGAGKTVLRDALGDEEETVRDMALYLLDRGAKVPVLP